MGFQKRSIVAHVDPADGSRPDKAAVAQSRKTAYLLNGRTMPRTFFDEFLVKFHTGTFGPWWRSGVPVASAVGSERGQGLHCK